MGQQVAAPVKPGTVWATQVLLWINMAWQTAAALLLAVLVVLVAISPPRSGRDGLEGLVSALAWVVLVLLAFLGLVIVVALLASAALSGLLAVKIGAGRRWSWVTALTLGCLGLAVAAAILVRAGEMVLWYGFGGFLAVINGILVACLLVRPTKQWCVQ